MKLKYKNRLLFDIVIWLSSLIGLLLNFQLFKTPVGLLYYTIFSNLLCFVFYSYSIYRKLFTEHKVTRNFVKFKGLVLVSLVCTLLIYNFFMVPLGFVDAYEGHFIASCFVHIFTPVLVIADCIVNGKKKMLKYGDLFLYFITIVFYGLCVIFYQGIGGTFPDGQNYPYFNFNIELGLYKIIFTNIAILFTYFIISFSIILINRLVIKNDEEVI